MCVGWPHFGVLALWAIACDIICKTQPPCWAPTAALWERTVQKRGDTSAFWVHSPEGLFPTQFSQGTWPEMPPWLLFTTSEVFVVVYTHHPSLYIPPPCQPCANGVFKTCLEPALMAYAWNPYTGKLRQKDWVQSWPRLRSGNPYPYIWNKQPWEK